MKRSNEGSFSLPKIEANLSRRNLRKENLPMKIKLEKAEKLRSEIQ